MTKLVILTLALAALPPSCAKLLGKKPVAAEEPAPSADVPPPISSATAPPIWHAPEPPSSGDAPATSASAGAASGPVAPGPDVAKARAALEAKEYKKVRTLLDKRVLHGKCAPEEAQLLYKACTALKDKTCIADVRAKHGEDLGAL